MPVHHIRFIANPPPSDRVPVAYKIDDEAWVSFGECAYWNKLGVIEIIGGAPMIPTLMSSGY